MYDQQLKTIQAAITVMADLVGQNHTLVLEMAQRMLADLLDHGELQMLDAYVRRYCDVIDDPEGAAPIVAEIKAEDAAS